MSITPRCPLLFKSNSFSRARYRYDLGKVSKVGVVGSGSFGTVYRVNIDGVERCAKYVRDNRNSRIELFILLSLPKHENILRFYDYKVVREIETKIMLVTEFIDGKTLIDYIEENMSRVALESFAVHIFYKLLLGLSVLHKNKIAHRDIKLENIMIVECNTTDEASIRPVIIDFGLATIFDKVKSSRKLCGSMPYIPPEIILGHEYIGPELDVWSMGVVFYATLHAHFPFEIGSEVQYYNSILFGPPHVDASEEMRSLVLQMISVKPSARPTAAELLKHQLFVKHGLVPQLRKSSTAQQLNRKIN